MFNNKHSHLIRITVFIKCHKITLTILIIFFSGIGSSIWYALELPKRINQFSDEFPILREKWLNATQWTGLYSCCPEGIVNLAELELSWDSDTKIYLEYSEEDHVIDGYIHSNSFCQMGLLYRSALLTGSPKVWTPDRLNLDVFEIVEGHTVILDKIRIDREVPQGIISVRSLKHKRLIHDMLRLAPDPELDEGKLFSLGSHCIDLEKHLVPDVDNSK